MFLNFIYAFFIFVYSHRELVEIGLLPGATKWLTDLFSIAFLLMIFLFYAISKRFFASPIYLFLILMTMTVAIFGAVINDLSASTLIIGLRHHFKYLPFFIIPMVYNFSIHETKKIFTLLLFIFLIQLPVTIFQRFFMFSHVTSGDLVGGTISSSGALSIILVSSIAILYSFYLTKQISLKTMLTLSFFLFLPTTINETKATFILIPFGLAIATLFHGDKNIILKFRTFFVYSIFSIIFISSFIFIYDAIYGSKFQSTLFDFLAREKEGKGYLYYGDEKTQIRIEEGKRIGRIDSVITAFKQTSEDLGKIAFGVGIGNALTTRISFLKADNLALQKFHPDLITFTNILWEMGILGIILHICLLLMLLYDSLALRVNGGYIGAIGLGWSCVVCIMIINLFYLNIFYSDALNTTFWFISGIISSKKNTISSNIENSATIE